MPPVPAAAAQALPPTCSIKGLVAFGPGVFKGELYSPARCDQVADNFAALGGHPPPLAKIGHDVQQRYARSLGFPNVGRVTRCAKVGGGCWEIDIEGVPTEVGGKVNAGLLRGASVELKPHYRDPRDPARELPGDVLTGVSLLGEEQPCVTNWPAELRARAVPRATFADGRPVPPSHELSRWLDLAAEVSDDIAAEQGAQFSADRSRVRIGGREYDARTLCFSAFDPNPGGRTMTPEEIRAKLTAAGKSPEEVEQILAALGAGGATPPPAPAPAPPPPGDGDMMAACAKFAADPAATPEQKMMAAMAKKFADIEGENAELKKRFGAYEAAKEADQKKTEEAQMAAFSDKVAAACKPLYERIAPVVVDKVHRPTLMGVMTARTFASEGDRVKAFNDYLAPLLALPPDPRLAAKPGPAVTGTGGLSAAGLKVLGAVKDVNPRVYAKHAATA
jgi:hypothetical protein